MKFKTASRLNRHTATHTGEKHVKNGLQKWLQTPEEALIKLLNEILVKFQDIDQQGFFAFPVTDSIGKQKF